MTRQLLRGSLLLSLLTCAAACGSPENRAGPNSLPEGYANAGAINLEHTLTIGEETGTIFGRLIDLAVTENGRIYVADYANSHIRVFSPEGDSLATVGRKGEGPGEFSALGAVVSLERGIGGYDFRTREIELFTHEDPPRHRSTVSLPTIGSQSTPRTILAANSKGFIVRYSPGIGSISGSGIRLGGDQIIVGMDTAGRVLQDTLVVAPGRQHIVMSEGNQRSFSVMPFARAPSFAVGPDGSIYYGRTDSLRIERYTSGGDRVASLNLPYKHIPVSEAEMDSIMSDRSEWSRKILTNSDAVSTRPAFDKLVTDDTGRLWIDVIGEPTSDMSPWKIVDFDDGTVRQADLPANVSVEAIRDGRVYGIRTAESGIQEVVVYQISSNSS